jgi:hypothetical protein
VYNGARIALGARPRARELALPGFTRAEVSAMLLGEQAILTAAAIRSASASIRAQRGDLACVRFRAVPLSARDQLV